MIHTKTPAGTYDKNDYWTVSYIDTRSDNPDDHEEVVREYGDVDNAYEDYCYFKKQWWTKDCTYKHHKR
jgi:hypothetical protein